MVVRRSKVFAVLFSYAVIGVCYPSIRYNNNWINNDFVHQVPKLAAVIEQNAIFADAVTGTSTFYQTIVLITHHITGLEPPTMMLYAFPFTAGIGVFVVLAAFARRFSPNRTWLVAVGLLSVTAIVTFLRASGKHSAFTYPLFFAVLLLILGATTRRRMLVGGVLFGGLLLFHLQVSAVLIAFLLGFVVFRNVADLWTERSLLPRSVGVGAVGTAAAVSWVGYLFLSPLVPFRRFIIRRIPPYPDTASIDAEPETSTPAPETETDTTPGTGTETDTTPSSGTETTAPGTETDTTPSDTETTAPGTETDTTPSGNTETATPSGPAEPSTETPATAPEPESGVAAPSIDGTKATAGVEQYVDVLTGRWEPWWAWIIASLPLLLVMLVGGITWITSTVRAVVYREQVSDIYVLTTVAGGFGLVVAVLGYLGFSATNLIFRYLVYFVPIAAVFVAGRRVTDRMTRSTLGVGILVVLLVTGMVVSPVKVAREPAVQEVRFGSYDKSTHYALEHAWTHSGLNVTVPNRLNAQAVAHIEQRNYKETNALPFTTEPGPLQFVKDRRIGDGDPRWNRVYTNGEAALYRRTTG